MLIVDSTLKLKEPMLLVCRPVFSLFPACLSSLIPWENLDGLTGTVRVSIWASTLVPIPKSFFPFFFI